MNCSPYPTSAQPAAFLESTGGDHIPLAATCTIGRTKTNVIVIASEKVSRRHALIHRDAADEHLLIDLGSSNGTFLNGSRVTSVVTLSSGDVVTIGGHSFTFKAPDDEAEQASTVHRAGGSGTQFVPCWMLVADTENSSSPVRRVNDDDMFKTAPGWLLECHRIIERHDGAVTQHLGEGIFAHWSAFGSTEPTAKVLLALDELHDLHRRRRCLFRMALHYGTVVSAAAPSSRQKALVGNEVIFVFQMQKLAWVLAAPCLISEAAHAQFGHLRTMRPLEKCAMTGYFGDHQFFAL